MHMSTNADADLFDAVKRIAPVIQQHADEAERAGRLSPATVEAMREARLFRMFNPQALGGLEVSPLTCARVIEAVSALDSAAGWALSNPVAYTHYCARLPDAGPQEIFGRDPDAIIAGPFHPPLHASPAPGGFHISGRAPLASNCREAAWIAVSAMVMEGERPSTDAQGLPQTIFAFLRAQDCKIIETWSVLGMRGTGSDDISVDSAFVPAARTFPLVPEFEPGAHYRSPLYRFPAMGVLAVVLPPVTLAIARQAIEEVKAVAQGKTPFISSSVLQQRASAQAKVAQAEAAVRSGRALLYDTLAAAWEKTLAGERLSLEEKTDLLLAATNAVQSSAKAVEWMYSVAGTTGIYTRSPLERHFRDMEVLKQHGFTSENRWETTGQVYLGLQPDFALVAF
jgi:alkylation response protein AidB-like acyl-CoA dehydrogenase